MTKPKKKTVREKIESVYIDLGWTLIDDAIQNLVDAKAEGLRRGYTDLRIEMINDCGCWGSCSCSPRPVLMGERLENDKEFVERVAKEAEQRAAQEAKERAEFERLQAKFGKS